MTRAKKHHFISQFYLRGFAQPTGSTNRGKSHRLGVVDTSEKLFFAGLVKNFAFQNNFNRLENYHDHENELENSLAKLESELSQSVDTLNKTGVLIANDTENLITLMALFASRTPAVRKQIISQTRIVEEELYHALSSFPHLSENRSDGVTFESLQEAKASGQMTPTELTQDSIIHTEFILVRDLIRDLSRRKWSVVKCDLSQYEFITSDCPLVLHVRDGGISPIHFSQTSILDPRTDMYFPVTKTTALIGVLTTTEFPDADDYVVALLNTWVVNNGGRNFYSRPEGFVVLNEEGEISTHEDVLKALATYIPDNEENSTHIPQSKAEDWLITDVDDLLDMIKPK